MRFLNTIKNKLITKRKICCLLLIAFLCSIFAIKMATAEVSNNKELNILEIQPGDNFIIKGDKNLSKTGIDTKSIQGYNVNIEHISMPEFIGRTDQLNGKYDVIVIGRNYKSQNKDRDYSGINNNGKEINGTIYGTDGSMLPNGNYVENDITIRKAKEIKEFINSGQLVYINTKIFEVSNSKIKEYFESEISNNLIKYSDNKDIELSKIVNDYSKAIIGSLLDKNNEKISINIRPRITATCSEGDSTEDKNGDSSKRHLKYFINIPEDTDRYTVKLFLDINGDGVFSEKECYERKSNVIAQENYKISHYLGSQFVGYLQWKIQIEKGNGIKSYITGNIFFKRLEGQPKKTIKVLQVYPEGGLDLTNNNKFKEDIKLDDYDISIEKMKTSDFDKQAGNKLKLNGNYNMIIIGFQDSYGGKDIKNKEALDELQSFINSGQSVMFTHDTMALRMKTPNNASVELTKRFRDFVGQSRFIDSFVENNETTTNENEPNYIYTTDAYNEYDSSEGIYNDRNIPHINLGNDRKIVGYALNGKKNTVNTTNVYKTNSGLINNYPYKLGETINVTNTHNQWYQLNLEDPDVVPWYNLEYDGKLNKYDCRNNYYTYSKGNITYSGTGHSNSDSYNKNADDELKLFVNTIVKAERGANHAPIINCSIPNESNSDNTEVNEVNYAQNYYFSINASDYENDIVKMNISIDGIDISEDNIMSDLQLTTYKDKYEKEYKVFSIKTSDLDREDVRLKIPTAKLREALNNNVNIKVDIKAWDTLGALSTKTYVIKPIKSEASIDVQFQSATPNTAKYGQPITVKYEVTPNDYYYNPNISNSSKIDEAIFLVDLSDNMKNGQRLTQVKSNITKVIDDVELNNIRLGIIGFDKDSVVGNRKNENDPKSSTLTQTDGNVSDLIKPLYKISEANEKDGFRIFLQENILKASENTIRNLDTALVNADGVFDSFGESGKEKAIIIISSGNFTYTDEEINKIREKGYKIITVDMSGESRANMHDVHNKLGGDNDDYIVSQGDNQGNFNFVGSDMEKVAECLKSGVSLGTNIITSAKFNFNLGDYFEPQSDSYLVNVQGNKYKLDVTDKIKYVKTDETDEKGNIKYTGQPFEVEFTIKLKDKQYKGNLGFNTKSYTDEQYINEQLINGIDVNNDSNFEYKDINNYENISLSVKTPVIKIKKNEIGIEHGVYNGFDEKNEPDISSNGQSFPGNAIVPLAAYITGIENDQIVQLTMSEGINNYGIDKIYYIANDNNVSGEVAINNAGVITSDGNQLKYKVSNLPQECNRILILYHETLPQYEPSSGNRYENNIEVIGENKNTYVTVGVSSDDMPDLF